MNWLVVLLSLTFPRTVIFVLWFFTQWFTGLFNLWLWPVLGFIFMPYTLLWCSVVLKWYRGHWGPLEFFILTLAILVDFSAGRLKICS